MPTIKITETVRANALKRPLAPNVFRDTDIPGLALHVTTRRGFWALIYAPRGFNPATGKRWSGGVRHELGDAMLMTVSEAKAAALGAKALVRQGRSPHHEAMAATAANTAARAVAPKSAGEALDIYTDALMNRREPKAATRRQSIHYAGKAIAFMNTSSLPLTAIDERAIRLMLEAMPGSDAERRHVFGSLSRFLAWCRKQGLVTTNPCDALDRNDRPKPGRARDHVPSLKQLRATWAAVEAEPMRDLARFLLLVPLRRDEAAGLRWDEVDLAAGRIRIAGDRMKNREAHELPLSLAALAILEALKAEGELVFPTSAGKPFDGWTRLLRRIRKRLGQGEAPKAQRFSLHDVRRAFVSHLAEHGFDVDALDQVLGHSRKGVLAIYQHATRMRERARALEAWAGLIAGEEASSNVVAFKAAR